MNFIYGNKEEAIEFLKNISQVDEIGVFSHDDNDGLTAGFLLDKFLKPKVVRFVEYGDKIARNIIEIVKEKKLNKVIMTDLSPKSYLEDILELGKIVDLMILDHHEFDRDLNKDGIVFLKTNDFTCAANIVYSLLLEIWPEVKKFDWLVAQAIVADYVFDENKEFVNRIEDKYGFGNKSITSKQASQSDIGLIVQKITNSTVYFKENYGEFYNIFRKIEKLEDISRLDKYFKAVDEEINKHIDKFRNECDNVGIMKFYIMGSRFSISSVVSTIVAGMYPMNAVIILDSERYVDQIRINARCQSGEVNFPQVLEEVLESFERSSSGGHIKAAGGRFLKKDLEKFKRRLFEYFKK